MSKRSNPAESPSEAVEAMETQASFVRTQAIRSTARLLAAHGLDITMDQIAAASGIGRRSLFRHFDSRDALVSEALIASFDRYEEQLHAIADEGGSLDEWLETLVRRTHECHLAAGRGIWQLASAYEDALPADYQRATIRRRTMRERSTSRLAERAWTLAGGTGPTPQTVIDAMALVVSSFATYSLIDLARNPATAAHSGAAIIGATLREAVPRGAS